MVPEIMFFGVRSDLFTRAEPRGSENWSGWSHLVSFVREAERLVSLLVSLFFAPSRAERSEIRVA